jgi:hypothetical protein
MRKEAQERRSQISVPLADDLREAIEEAARAEHRTVAGQIRHWISDALIERGGRGRQVQQRAGA